MKFLRAPMAFITWLSVLIAPTFIERMALASQTKPWSSTVFSPSDRVIKCAVALSKPTFRTKVRFEWKLMYATGPSPAALLTTEYTTKPLERFARSCISLLGDWPAGAYRVDAYVGESPAKTIDYVVVQPESV